MFYCHIYITLLITLFSVVNLPVVAMEQSRKQIPDFLPLPTNLMPIQTAARPIQTVAGLTTVGPTPLLRTATH